MLALLLLAIASAALAHEGHNDGHVIEWTITGEPFELCVNPDEPVTFKWEGAAHNVVMVESKDDYDNCFVPENMREAEEDRGGITFKARQEGTYYFVCGVGGHCEFGKQKAQITVSGTCA